MLKATAVRGRRGARARAPLRRVARGAGLVEALVAVVIVSSGLLGLLKLQADSIVRGRDAQYRTQARALVHEIIGVMWTDRANLARYQHRAGGAPCEFSGPRSTHVNALNWLAEFTASASGRHLPGATPDNQQIVVEAGSGSAIVRVRVCWRAPQDARASNVVAVAQIPL